MKNYTKSIAKDGTRHASVAHLLLTQYIQHNSLCNAAFKQKQTCT
jgi:hypothetical protein